MRPLFQRPASTKLEAARTSLATARTRLADLERERAAALAGDDMNSLHRISAAVAQQQAVVRDLSDRVAALAVQKRQEDAAERERARTAAIDGLIAPSAAECVELAAELEKTLARAVDLIEAIETKRQAIEARRPEVPRPQFHHGAYFSLFDNHRGHADEFARDLKVMFPGAAARVRKGMDGWIAELRKAPFPPPPDDDVGEQEQAA
jgi:multidrug efflux pump subunit AcrA (membrane-fusion protein)